MCGIIRTDRQLTRCRVHVRGDRRRIAITTEKAPAGRSISTITDLLIAHKGVCDVLSAPSSAHLNVSNPWLDIASDIGITKILIVLAKTLAN